MKYPKSRRVRRVPALHRLAVGMLLVAGAVGCNAADGAHHYAVWGVGQASCHQFEEAYAANDLTAFKAYLGGYLTAYDTLSQGATSLATHTLQELLATLADHCAKNPMDSYERAIQALLADAAGEKQDSGGGTWGRPAGAARQ